VCSRRWDSGAAWNDDIEPGFENWVAATAPETRRLALHTPAPRGRIFRGARPTTGFDTSPKPIDDDAVIFGPAPVARQFCFASAPRKVDCRPCRFTFPHARRPDEIATKIPRRIRCGALPLRGVVSRVTTCRFLPCSSFPPAALGGSKWLRPTTELIRWKSDDPSAWLFFL